MGETKYWQNDDRLRAVRDQIGDLGMKLHMAELNLKQATRYTDPPDEVAADRFLLEQADCHDRIGLAQRELVRLRRVVRAEYAARGGQG